MLDGTNCHDEYSRSSEMRMTSTTRLRQAGFIVAIATFATVSGCGRSDAVLEGDVAYQGKPVETGLISLMPKDGQTATVGGAISNGKYRITKIPPGEKIAKVTITFPHPPVNGSGDAGKVAVKPPLAPPESAGNNKAVRIGVGVQRLDFQFTP
jgi:hypothetical protein